ncbi:MAG TPA: hypothetical protein VER17_07235 [Tepidisphaeraceae bacterium]|nr:hypothetical protein [Tepidisphaeraceae bacterium]
MRPQPEQDEREAVHAVDLGIISLQAAPGWRFYPLADRVVARPASGVGGITFIRLPGDALPGAPSHERCMGAAVVASKFEVDPPGVDRAQEWADGCLAGGESFVAGGDFARIWYRHTPEGIIAAWFACKVERATERGVITSIHQGDKMISTIRIPPPLS